MERHKGDKDKNTKNIGLERKNKENDRSQEKIKRRNNE